MPSSNILLFDANKANMMSDEQYNTNTQRLNGVQSGIASSQLQNKTLYQVSLVAYAIAQIMNQNGLDANDTAAVSAFVANLSGTMLQKVADLASTQEAQAGVATGKWMSPALVKAAMDTYTSGKWLPLTGGTMKGNLILNADPTVALGAATKQYVDNNKATANLFKKRLAFQATKNAERSGAVQYGTIPNINIGEIGALFLLKCNSLNISGSGSLYYYTIDLRLNASPICKVILSGGKVYNQELPFVLFFSETSFYSDYITIGFTGVDGSFNAGEQSIDLNFSFSRSLTVSGTITLSVYYF